LSENFQRGKLWTPEIDEWAATQRRELRSRTTLEPLWPGGRRFAVCLTHDVDMVSRQATALQAARSLWLGLAARGYRNRRYQLWAVRAFARLARFRLARVPPTAKTLERCIAIEQEAGVVSSYFFAVYPDGRKSPYDCVYSFSDPCLFRSERRRIADVIRWIGEEGFDVGLHGGYHTALDGGTLLAEKRALEDAAGRAVTTTRQHYLHWHRQTTPALQHAAGLRADSTLGYNRNVGFRAGTSLPFRLLDPTSGRVLDVLEVPLVLQDGALLARHALALDAVQARGVVARMVDTLAAVSGVATILFHPHLLVDHEIADLYRWTIQYCQEQGAWVTSLRRIDEWWRKREAALTGAISASDGHVAQELSRHHRMM
jgi:peptidoglycan/xylan/chitin deacetylase (PgdA/CDA1 family)